MCAALVFSSLGLPQTGWAQDSLLRMEEEVAQQTESAIVYLTVTFHKTPESPSSIEAGSGFFVNDTCLVTNYHVIEGALRGYRGVVEARVFSGTPQSQVYTPHILAVSQAADLALLQIPTRHEGINPLRIAPGLPGKQTEVYAFGFPLGSLLDRSSNGPNVSLRRGYVSRIINDGTAVEADVNLDKGISGGPLTDHLGHVRGVVRSIAGSDANRSYAGISIASPILLEFCKSHGARLTLTDGTIMVSDTPLPAPLPTGQEPSPRPRRSLGQDILRAYFAVGSQLRLTTLIPQMLKQQKEGYTEDILRNSKSNVDLVVANLTRVQAPVELLQRARELGFLLSQAQVTPALLAEKAAVLERACDEWVNRIAGEEQVNYALGAWLTELSIGLISPESDLKNASFFVKTGEEQRVSVEVLQLLQRIQQRLAAVRKDNDATEKRALRKDADRLIAIGFMPTAGEGLNPLPKVTTPQPPATTGNNPIRLPGLD